jgi:hypothetical protein
MLGPDGRTAYVLDSGATATTEGPGAVVPVDLRTDQAAAPIALPAYGEFLVTSP